jgi:hypothetical protein
VIEQPAGEPPPLPAEPEWAPRIESPAESEVVEGDVVQEMDTTPPVVDAEAAQPAETEAPGKARGRGGRGRRKPAREGTEVGEGEAPAPAPRTRARKQAAVEGAAPKAPRKAAKPRARKTS